MRRIRRHQLPIGIGNQRNAYGSRYADDEGEDGRDDDRHEGSTNLDELVQRMASPFKA